MKMLIAGNSHASCLKIAYDKNNNILNNCDVSFYITPGGYGPHFYLEDDQFKVPPKEINPKFPPRFSSDSVVNSKVNDYDLIFVSAVGFIDPGPAISTNIIVKSGVLHQFQPILNNNSNTPLVSKLAFESVANNSLSLQRGFRFIQELKSKFSGRIIIQPSPYFSENLKNDEKWSLVSMYQDWVGMHKFVSGVKNRFINELVDSDKIFVLDYPKNVLIDDYYTKSEYMMADNLHGNSLYGVEILNNLNKYINK